MSRLKPSLITRLKPPPQSPPSPTVKSFNAAITHYSSQNSHNEVILTYISLLKANITPDAYTFPSLFKSCTSLNLPSLGLLLHQRVVVHGYSEDAYISSSLINFYSNFGDVCNARKVFDSMPVRNVVPWTAIVGCYTKMGCYDMSLYMYNCMRGDGVLPSYVTFLSLLIGVSDLTHVWFLHACAVKFGFLLDLVLVNSFLNVYGKCGSFHDARKLFDMMGFRDIVSWNSMVACYAQLGNVEEVLQFFNLMQEEGMKPDQQTYGSAMMASTNSGAVELGKMVHGKIVKAGFESDTHVETSILVMYLKCGHVDDALLVFNETQERDNVLWTAMISGLIQNGKAENALMVFRWMLSSGIMLSTATIASVLAACAQLGSFNHGASIHGYILRQNIELDVPALNSLLTLYAKCGYLQQSCFIFEGMGQKDVVSWNAIVSAHAQKGNLSNALLFFSQMRLTLQRPDSITVVSLLQGCASLAALDQGKLIHSFVIRSCLRPCILIVTALVDMYSKCGALDTSKKCFDLSLDKDLVLWSSLIAGYGSHGKGEMALRMYSEFLQTGIEPNDVLFLSVLSACSHNGLVEEGLSLFETMIKDYAFEPKLEHRACIVDLLCRAKRVEEAYEFYKRMFPEPMIDALGIILDACQSNGKEELGHIIARDVLVLKPVSAGNYVQLVHSYASLNKWEGVGEMWVQMKSLGLKKIPGWSYIELHGEIETFFMNHSSHPQIEEMLTVLKSLSGEMSNKLKQLDYQVYHDDLVLNIVDASIE